MVEYISKWEYYITSVRTLRVQVSWDMMLCHWLGRFWQFKQALRLHLQGQAVWGERLMIDIVSFPEASSSVRTSNHAVDHIHTKTPPGHCVSHKFLAHFTHLCSAVCIALFVSLFTHLPKKPHNRFWILCVTSSWPYDLWAVVILHFFWMKLGTQESTVRLSSCE